MRRSATQETAGVNGKKRSSNTPVGAPEQRRANDLENEIRQPHNEVRRPFRAGRERLPKNDETVVNEHQRQGDGDTHIRFTPMNPNTERYADERKTKTGKRKRHLPVKLDADWGD